MNKVFYILLLLLFFSCKKKEVGPQCPSCKEVVEVKTKEVLIACEGNFGWGNASISKYDPIEKNVTNAVFSSVNGYSLGDVAQSMELINGDLYVVVNNSGKIEVLDTATDAVKQTISGLTSPRYIEPVSLSKAYISDLYANKVSILDLSTHQVTGTINTGGWTENMVLFNDKVYITRPDSNFVLIADPTTDQITDTLVLSTGPNSLVVDKNNHLWVLCDGGINKSLPALYEIDPNDNSILKSLLFSDINNSPGKLIINSQKGQLFYLNGNMYSLSIDETTLPQTPKIEVSGVNFYGLGIDPNNNNIYLTDPKDYIQKGLVYRYDSLSSLLDTFSTGIIPQAFWFK